MQGLLGEKVRLYVTVDATVARDPDKFYLFIGQKARI